VTQSSVTQVWRSAQSDSKVSVRAVQP
jgi:hypothetical protein